MLLHCLDKLKIKSSGERLKNPIKFDKNKTSIVIYLNIIDNVTTVLISVYHLHSHMCEDDYYRCRHHYTVN